MLIFITILVILGMIIEFISIKQNGIIGFAYGFMFACLIFFWYVEVNNISFAEPIVIINRDIKIIKNE